MNFTIKRATWDRGQMWTDERIKIGIDETVHLKSAQDGRMCCLGFFLEACGVPSEEIEDQAGPAEVFNNPNIRIPTSAAWLVLHRGDVHKFSDTEDCEALMDINDNENLKDEERERQVSEIFARHDITVRFED